jgi:hypothetical protein
MEVSANGGMGEVSFHDIFLFLCLALDGVEFDSLPLHICKARVLYTQGVNVSDDTCIAEVE